VCREDEPPADAGSTPDSPPTGAATLRPNQARQSRTDPEATSVDRPEFGRHLRLQSARGTGLGTSDAVRYFRTVLQETDSVAAADLPAPLSPSHNSD